MRLSRNTFLFLILLLTLSYSCSSLNPTYNSSRKVASYDPTEKAPQLIMRVVSVSKDNMASDVLTRDLSLNPEIKWYKITSGTQASTIVIYPESLDPLFNRGLRNIVGGGLTFLKTTVSIETAKKIEKGNQVLKILDYNPESYNFGTTAMEQDGFSELKFPEGSTLVQDDFNGPKMLFIPRTKVVEFERTIQKQLPLRSVYTTVPEPRKLKARVISVQREGFLADVLTVDLGKNPEFRWMKLTSGTIASSFVFYPSDLEKDLLKGMRNIVGGAQSLATFEIDEDILDELSKGENVLSVLDYNPESIHFGTTSMEDFNDFNKLAKIYKLDPSIKIVSQNSNFVIAIVPLNKVEDFKKWQRQLPVRNSYMSTFPEPIKALKSKSGKIGGSCHELSLELLKLKR